MKFVPRLFGGEINNIVRFALRAVGRGGSVRDGNSVFKFAPDLWTKFALG